MSGAEPARIRVVVADDMPDIRALLRISLERDGRFRVVGEASNGVEAVEAAARDEPHAVVLDLAMPVKDGLQAIPEIKEAAPGAKILVLSGFDADEMSARAIEIGADGYLEKGEAFEDIAEALVRLCIGVVSPDPVEPLERILVPPAVVAQEAESKPDRDLIVLLTHDLRNNLAVIKGSAVALRDGRDTLSEEQLDRIMGSVERNAEHMLAMLEMVSDASRLDTDTLHLRIQPADLASLTRECVGDVMTASPDRPVDVAAPDRLEVEVDPVRVRQILGNLLSNALKFGPRGSHIDVSVGEEDGRAWVEVGNEGPRIPEEERERVFERFVRLDPGAAGTGLGLYIGRGLARAHGGELEVLPTKSGTRLRLSLPAKGQSASSK